MRSVSSLYGRRCCGNLVARLRLGLVPGPLPQREDRLLRLVDDLLAELDRLGQDDLFLGVEERHLADLLEVHPDRIVDADHVGGDRVQLLGGRLFRDLGVELGGRLLPRLSCRPRRAATSTPSSPATARPSSGGLVELVLGVVTDRRRRAGACRARERSPRAACRLHPFRQCLLLLRPRPVLGLIRFWLRTVVSLRAPIEIEAPLLELAAPPAAGARR